ncbi:MAG: ABC transporter ATP-binding protein, partial [Candidatus Zixiibacteriota bacterium]
GPDFFTHFRTGDLVTRLTDDVAEKLSWFACSGIFRLYEAIFAVLFIVVMMISIDPWLTVWTAGPLPLLVLIFFKSSSALDRRYDHLQKRISSFNAVMEACFSGVRVIKAYVREKAQEEKFDAAAEDRRQAEIDAVKVTTVVDSLYMYIWQFGVVTVLAVGGFMVIKRGLTIGDLGTFVFYTVWLIFPMFDIGQFLVKSRQSAVSIDRLRELERFPVMVKDIGTETCTHSVKPALAFQDVSFGFPEQEGRILDGVSLRVGSGQTVALVGKVGAGKTWLVNMIPRLVDPSGGSILLDSIDLRRFTLADLRRNIGYVPQEPVLFSDTVRNNILFGRSDISDDLLEWAVEVAQLKEELAAFPNGLDTPIGTRGMSISGGQKQRLALA